MKAINLPLTRLRARFLASAKLRSGSIEYRIATGNSACRHLITARALADASLSTTTQENVNKLSVRCTAMALSSRSSNTGRRYVQTQTEISSVSTALPASIPEAAED